LRKRRWAARIAADRPLFKAKAAGRNHVAVQGA
jgi:hypothetical protein